MVRRFSPRTIPRALGIGVLLWLLWGIATTQSVPGPAYQVQDGTDGYEVRRYEGYLVAQVSVSGERVDAVREGRDILADYLDGDNAIQESFAMQRPLGVEPGPTSERIALIAPIVSQERGDAYVVSSILPSAYTIVTVPRPNNPRIRILQVASATLAVRSWWGSSSEERIQDEERALRDLLARDKRVILSAARTLHYSPSWVPPLVRRNEVAIPIRGGR